MLIYSLDYPHDGLNNSEIICPAYIPNEEGYWKFLCIKEKSGLVRVVYDYNCRRKDQFITVELCNEKYIVRDATDEDLDEALINKLWYYESKNR